MWCVYCRVMYLLTCIYWHVEVTCRTTWHQSKPWITTLSTAAFNSPYNVCRTQRSTSSLPSCSLLTKSRTSRQLDVFNNNNNNNNNVWTNCCWNLGHFQCVSCSASEWSWQEDLLDFSWYLCVCLCVCVYVCLAPCGLRGCKNGPAPFPGRMSYKATKPGLVFVLYLSMFIIVIVY